MELPARFFEEKMNMTTRQLIFKLSTEADVLIETVHTTFLDLPQSVLSVKATPEQWSVLECFEHLNRYARFYLPAVGRSILSSKTTFTEKELRYSWIGSFSIRMMDPKNVKKQRTFRRMDPSFSDLTRETLTEFLKHQQKLKMLLQQASGIDINTGGVPVEFFKLLKMRTGEALQFVMVHQQRHLAQAQRTLALQAHPQASLIL
jgi:hypothetical protein